MSFGYQVLGFGAGGPGFSYIEATGGTITTDGDYKINTFEADGTFTVTIGTEPTFGNQVEYMVVGGGGGGWNSYGGGGGGGGYRYNGAYDHAVTSQAYSIVVGTLGLPNNKGGDSSFDGISSTGGGRGGGPATGKTVGGDGGCGGGGSGHDWPPGHAPLGGGIGNEGGYSPVEGYNGAAGLDSPSGHYPCGGGGGSGADDAQPGGASPSVPPIRCTGGTGAQNDISGTSIYYSPGGGGNKQGHAPNAVGGYGGGGNLNGGDADMGNIPTTRGAGSGGGYAPNESTNGVDGVVAIRYKFQ